MSNFVKKITMSVTGILSAVILNTNITHAAGLITSFFNIETGVLAWIMSFGSYMALSFMGFILSIMGKLLNVSMFLTTHLGMFIDNNPVIYDVWQTIRDLSSLLLIFFILYAAIRMIIGTQPKYGELIKNIVIMGILINFSFFAARICIDASNIVSLQIYNAIAPEQTASISADNDLVTILKSLNNNTGLADIIMGAVRIPAFWAAGDSKPNDNSSDDIKQTIDIFMKMGIGIIVTFITAIQFLIISLANIFRVAALMFLLAFSPVWIAAMAIPQLKEFSNEWWKHFQAQLLFLPVFLIFEYVALKVIIATNISTILQADQQSTLGNMINLAVGATIVLVVLAIPFMAAVKIAGTSMNWTSNWYKGVRGSITGIIGRNTVGRYTSNLDKTLGNTTLGNSLYGRKIRGITTTKLANAKYGGSTTYADDVKENKDIASKQKIIDRKLEMQHMIMSLNEGKVLTGTLPKDVLKKMSKEEKLSLGVDALKNREIAQHLKKEDYKAIAESDDFTDKEKEEIKTARKEAFKYAVYNGPKNKAQSDAVKSMMGEMDEKDLIDSGLLATDGVIEHLKPGTLKKLLDEGIDPGVRKIIGNRIRGWGRGHPAQGWINKAGNMPDWS